MMGGVTGTNVRIKDQYIKMYKPFSVDPDSNTLINKVFLVIGTKIGF